MVVLVSLASKNTNMPITTSWYSARKGTEVYHNNSGCTEENNIEPYNVKEGNGGLRLCKHCERLNKEEKVYLGLVGGIFSMKSFFSDSIVDSLTQRLKK